MDFSLSVVLNGLKEASEMLLKHYKNLPSIEKKTDGSPVTLADLASHEILVKMLKTTGIPYISEEEKSVHYDERKNWEYVWIVDPLDGTKEFIKQNDQFCICLALIHNQEPIFGAIASPCAKEILIGGKQQKAAILSFDTIDSPNKWKQLTKENSLNSITIACSSSHLSSKDSEFISKLKSFSKEVNFIQKGSALKFFDLAKNDACVYPRFAPTMEWDIAAGQAILEALAGKVVNAETNESLKYNKKDLHNPSFIASTFAFRNYFSKE